MINRAHVALLAVLALGGCSRDLNLPDALAPGQLAGRIDVQGNGSAAAQAVLLVKPTGARETTQTADDGTFVFDDLAPGQYAVKFTVPNFAPFTETGIVLSGQTTDLGALQPAFIPPAQREGVVRGKVVPPPGVPNAIGGQVELRLEGGTRPEALAAIGSSGDFVLRAVAGTYVVIATHPSFVSASETGLQLDPGEDLELTQPLQLGIDPATITGRVQREVDNAPAVAAEGALVTLEPIGRTTTTDAQGEFTLGGLAAGDYRVRVGLADYADPAGVHLLTLAPRQLWDAGTLDLELLRGTVVGTVEMGDGRTSDGVSVTLTGTGYGTVVSPSAMNLSRGTFRIPSVPVGTKEVVARKNGYLQAVKTQVQVRAHETTDVGLLGLAVQQGDFVIDDGDPAVPPDFTAVRAVTLLLTNAPGATRFRASEDQTFTGVAFGAFTATPVPFLLGSSEGRHVVYAQYEDANGVRSPTLQAAVILDSVAPANPSLAIQGGAGFTSLSQSLTLTLEATDPPPSGGEASGLARVRVSASSAVDASGNLLATPVAYQRDLPFTRPPPQADGPQSVSVQFIDRAGNASAVITRSIVVDTLPPTGGLAIARGARATVDGFTDSNVVQLDLTAATEPHGGFLQLRLANSQAGLATAPLQTFTSPITWQLDTPTEELKTVYLRLVDAAGNVSSDLSARITLDRTAPSPATASIVGATGTNPTLSVSSLTLQLATDTASLSPGAGVTVSEDPFFQGSGTVGPMAYPGNNQVVFALSPADGPKRLYVRFRDRAGNDAVVTVSLTRDTEAPTGGLTLRGTLADGTSSSAVSATTAVTAQLSQAGATEYLLGNEGLSSCNTTGYAPLPPNLSFGHTLTGSATPRQVRLCLRDAAGNTSALIIATIALDTSAPGSCALTLTGAKVDGGTPPTNKTAQRVISADFGTTCAEVPVEMSLTTAASIDCTPTAPLAWTPWSRISAQLLSGNDGLIRMRGCVRDAAHNVGSVVPGDITLDTQPPQAPLITIDDGAEYLNQDQVTQRGGLRASVRGSATGAVEWGLSESPAAVPVSLSYTANNPSTFTFAGTGPRTLYAVFGDDLGNLSAVASAAIDIDLVAPSLSGVTLALQTPSGNAFTNSVSVTALVDNAPADAEQLTLRQTLSPTDACDFTGLLPRPFTRASTFVLTSGDGAKRVCARLTDAAGNGSLALSRDVTLDTVSPAPPQLTNPSAAFVSLADSASWTVNTLPRTASSDFARFEVQGGKFTTWSQLAVPQSTTAFPFQLNNLGSQTGTTNTLRLRVADLAGNLSAEASVEVTADTVPPQAVVMDRTWVDNRPEQVDFFWQPPPTPQDVDHYLLAYGPASNTYNGTVALEGPSPLAVPATLSHQRLSGLVNGTTLLARVTAVDRAGNVGPAPGAFEVRGQPNTVSPSVVHDIDVAMNQPERIVVRGDLAWIVGNDCDYFSNTISQTVVTVVSLAPTVAPYQSGLAPDAGVPPVVLGRGTFATANNISCGAARFEAPDFILDGQYAYLSGSNTVRAFRLTGSPIPSATTQIASVTPFGTEPVSGLSLEGNVLLAYGPGRAAAISVAQLYDNNAATRSLPLIGTVGTASNSFPGYGLVTTRNLMLSTCNADTFSFWSYTSALTSGSFSSSNFLGEYSENNMIGGMGDPQISGNYLFVPGFGPNSRFQVRKLNSVWAPARPLSAADLPLLASTSAAGNGPAAIDGPIAWVPEQYSKLRMLDLSQLSASPAAINPLALFDTDGNHLRATATWGNFQLVVTEYGRLQVLQTAIPSSLRVVGRSLSPGGRHELSGGMLVTSQVSVLDLLAPLPPPNLGNPAEFDSYSADVARFGDSIVLPRAVGTAEHLRVVSLDVAVDRDPATPLITKAADSYPVTLAPNTLRVLAVEAWGNYLVVLEDRPTAGTWLEIFSALPLRDHDPATSLSATPIASAQISAQNSPFLANGDLQIVKGRAVAVFESHWNTDPSQGLVVVDLRPATDDDAATTGLPILATLPVVGGWTVRLSGGTAWVSAQAGVEGWNIANALADPPTAVTSTAPSASAALNDRPRALAVYGPWLFASSSDTRGGVWAYDVSTPGTMRLAGFLEEPVANLTGNIAVPSAITVWANRLYYTSPTQTTVLELE